MGVAYLEKNQKVRINNVEHRLIREIPGELFQLEKISTGKIIVKTKNELHGMLVKGDLVFINEHNYLKGSANDRVFDLKSLDLYPEKAQEKARTRYAYVTEILRNKIGVFTKDSLKPVITEVWTKLGEIGKKPDWSTVYRWIKKYQEAGDDIRSLIDRNNKKGNRGRRFPGEVITIVKNSIDEIYLTRERHSIKDVIEHASYRVIQENKLRPKSLHLPLPTRRLVEHEVKQLSKYDVCVARYGRQHAIRKFRSVENVYEANHILEVAEIDHTQIALYVVDEERMLPLGRPWVTIIIDNYSRSILGIHISFNPPSYLSVAKCFKHAILPKSDLREIYPEIVNEWHSHGIMETLVVDNAFEFYSNHLAAACYPFGVSIQYTPRKTPWFKGKIERFNRTMEAGTTTGTPGRTFENILEKDDYDVAKNATITLSTLKKIIHLWIADYYHQDIHRTIGKSPSQAWKESAEQVPIALPEDVADLDSLLGSVATRTLSHSGIEIFTLKYNSPELKELRMECGYKFKADIRYNEDNLGYIYVIHPETGEAIKVNCINQEYAADLTLYQHKIIRKFALKYIKDNRNIEALCEAKEKIRELIRKDMFNKKSKSRVRKERFMNENEFEKLDKINSTEIVTDFGAGNIVQDTLNSGENDWLKKHLSSQRNEIKVSKSKRNNLFNGGE